MLELSDALKLSRKSKQNDKTPFITVLVLGNGEKQIAFRVDELVNEQEVLAKSLGKQLIRVPNIAGATILSTGKVALILNVHDLLKSPDVVSRSFEDLSTRAEEEKKKSVLVVEDSITSRMLFKNILEGAGYMVKTATDGQNAYTMLKKEPFNLVVSDVQMPVMDGFELTAKIRGNKKLADTPVVLITGSQSDKERERGIDIGANAYIVKSGVDQDSLIDVVGRLI